jgi:hypothetical protein
MADERAANADEGASPENDAQHAEGKKTHAGVEAHMTPHYDLDIDVPPAQANKGEDDDRDEKAQELERTREHADPSKGDKSNDDGQRVSTDDSAEPDNPGN